MVSRSSRINLLLARDDARLARRAPAAIDQDAGVRNADALGLVPEQLAVSVVADDRAQGRARAERDETLRDVAAPPSR